MGYVLFSFRPPGQEWAKYFSETLGKLKERANKQKGQPPVIKEGELATVALSLGLEILKDKKDLPKFLDQYFANNSRK